MKRGSYMEEIEGLTLAADEELSNGKEEGHDGDGE